MCLDEKLHDETDISIADKQTLLILWDHFY